MNDNESNEIHSHNSGAYESIGDNNTKKPWDIYLNHLVAWSTDKEIQSTLLNREFGQIGPSSIDKVR